MAQSVNKVILIGRLGQDPKLSYLPSGSPVANFNMATDESYKDREGNKVDKVEWHKIVVFGRSAEFCANFLSKGRLVYVEGGLRTRSWEDQQGQKRYMTEVVVSGPMHTVQFLDSKGQGQDVAQAPEYGPRGQQGQPESRRPSPPQSMPEDDLGPAFPSEASGMDDVPF